LSKGKNIHFDEDDEKEEWIEVTTDGVWIDASE